VRDGLSLDAGTSIASVLLGLPARTPRDGGHLPLSLANFSSDSSRPAEVVLQSDSTLGQPITRVTAQQTLLRCMILLSAQSSVAAFDSSWDTHLSLLETTKVTIDDGMRACFGRRRRLFHMLVFVTSLNIPLAPLRSLTYPERYCVCQSALSCAGDASHEVIVGSVFRDHIYANPCQMPSVVVAGFEQGEVMTGSLRCTCLST
jgi:hypothetical protein